MQDVQGHTSARAVLQQPVQAKEALTIKTGNKNSERRLPLQYSRESLAGVWEGQGQALVKATYMAVEQRASLTG